MEYPAEVFNSMAKYMSAWKPSPAPPVSAWRIPAAQADNMATW